MTNKNYTSIGKLVGDYLDGYLYANRRKITEEGFAKLIGEDGVSAKTIQRWRYNGIPTTKGVDQVLQVMEKTIRDILEEECP